jgi:hypothetical protein
MKAAREIGIEQLRDANVRRITEEIAEIDGKAPANRP